MWVSMLSIGMVVVDAWLVYGGCFEEHADVDQRVFYCHLSEQLIGNSFDAVGLRGRQISTSQNVAHAGNGVFSGGVEAHLTLI